MSVGLIVSVSFMLNVLMSFCLMTGRNIVMTVLTILTLLRTWVIITFVRLRFFLPWSVVFKRVNLCAVVVMILWWTRTVERLGSLTALLLA